MKEFALCSTSGVEQCNKGKHDGNPVHGKTI
jgi:hypothetical protein